MPTQVTISAVALVARIFILALFALYFGSLGLIGVGIVTSVLMLYGLKKGGPVARWWVFALAAWIVVWNVGGVYVGTLEDGLMMTDPAAVFMLANGTVAVLVALSMLVPSSGAWFRQNDAFA